MLRKQIFLQERQDEALKRLAARSGRSEGAPVREAVGQRPAQEERADVQWEALLRRWEATPRPARGRGGARTSTRIAR
jgi:hypothetical protein